MDKDRLRKIIRMWLGTEKRIDDIADEIGRLDAEKRKHERLCEDLKADILAQLTTAGYRDDTIIRVDSKTIHADVGESGAVYLQESVSEIDLDAEEGSGEPEL